jgi:hypothetical protein
MKMMDELRVEAGKLPKPTNFLLCRRHLPIFNGFDFLVETENLRGDTV